MYLSDDQKRTVQFELAIIVLLPPLLLVTTQCVPDYLYFSLRISVLTAFIAFATVVMEVGCDQPWNLVMIAVCFVVECATIVGLVEYSTSTQLTQALSSNFWTQYSGVSLMIVLAVLLVLHLVNICWDWRFDLTFWNSLGVIVVLADAIEALPRTILWMYLTNDNVVVATVLSSHIRAFSTSLGITLFAMTLLLYNVTFRQSVREWYLLFIAISIRLLISALENTNMFTMHPLWLLAYLISIACISYVIVIYENAHFERPWERALHGALKTMVVLSCSPYVVTCVVFVTLASAIVLAKAY